MLPEVEAAASARFLGSRTPALPLGSPAMTSEKADVAMAQAEAWERLAQRLDAFRPEPYPKAPAEAERKVEMDGPDTGLSGLRKLLLSPGLGGVNKAGSLAARGAETASTPLPQGPSGEEKSAASQKFPSPKAPFESEEAEHAWVDGGNARRDRREPVDAVQILPSWRGQYKKKK